MIKNKILYSLIIIIILPLNIKAQNWARINEILYDAEYYFFTAQFKKAAEKYSEVLKYLPENANILYKLGICYLNEEADKSKAIEIFNKAINNINSKYNPNNPKEEAAPPEVFLLLGSAYRSIEKLDEAIECYNKYLNYLQPKQKKEKELTEQYIKSCYNAKEAIKSPIKIKYNNLGSIINNQFANINAAISGDGTTLVYTTEGKEGNYINISIKKDNNWTKPKDIRSQLANPGKYFKSVSLSYDGTLLILVEEDPLNAELYYSNFEKGRWMPAKKFSFNSKYNETHACITPDNKRIYFTSDRPGGKGDLDIYYIDIDNNGKFGKPINFEEINTPFNEETPFITSDGKYLFFSSEGFNSIGGYDIFYVDLTTSSKHPIPLEYPINTTDNDLFYFPINETLGLKSINHPDGFGSYDIYLIEKLKLYKIEGTFVYENNLIPAESPIVSIINEEGKIINYDITIEVNKNNFICLLPEGSYNINIIVPGFQLFEKKLYLTKNENIEVQLKPEKKQIELMATITDSIKETIYVSYIKSVKDETKNIKEQKIAKKEKPEIKHVKKEYIKLRDNIILADNNYFYTIQFLALKKPKNPAKFKELDNIFIHYNDTEKLYRYFSGIFNNIEEAEKYLSYIKLNGFKDAFIKKEYLPLYTIQIIALKKDIKWHSFKDLKEYSIFIGKDGFCRFTFGKFVDTKTAIETWKNLSKIGYTNAFIKKFETLLQQ